MLAAALLSLAVDAPTTADGWVRVINIKPSVDDSSCPGDLQHTVPPSGRAVCERGCTSSQCISTALMSTGLSYSKVRGYALARQYYSADAFGQSDHAGKTLDQTYVDGISLTTNAGGSRTHLWTWAVGLTNDPDAEGLTETPTNQYLMKCPCDGGQPAPTFVGTSFYCDSGNEECSQPDCWSPVWYENELYNTACEASSCIASPTPSTARARR